MAATITRTEHGDIVALTTVHDRAFERRLGGVRFVERGSVEEVEHLAAGMAEKCAASRVPLGGQKTLVICPGGIPVSADERAAILCEHIARAAREIPGGIFGPDMACGAAVLDLVAAHASVGAHVTGLSDARQGLDINGRALTARGLLAALDYHTAAGAPASRSATVQGFGMVGAPVARGLSERGIDVRAVSNRYGALIDEAGLDVPRLFALWVELGDDCLAAYADSSPANVGFDRDPNALFEVRADIFVPAARTTVLACVDELDACRVENNDVRPVEWFLDRSRCSLVLEAANHPLSARAEEYLEQRGAAILPDVLVNIGGMVGCYAEWRYRQLVQRGELPIDELVRRCEAYTARSVAENIRALVASEASARCAVAGIVRDNRAAMLSAPGARDDLLGLES